MFMVTMPASERSVLVVAPALSGNTKSYNPFTGTEWTSVCIMCGLVRGRSLAAKAPLLSGHVWVVNWEEEDRKWDGSSAS